MLRYWFMGAVSSTLLAAGSLGASAAPASTVANMQSAAQQMSPVDNVDYRRCRRVNGVKRCRWVETDDYEFYVGRPRPEAFPTGSTAWWRAMDYEGRGGHSRR